MPQEEFCNFLVSLDDTSEDFAETYAFLDRRIENVMQFEKFKAKAKDALANFPAFASWAKPK